MQLIVNTKICYIPSLRNSRERCDSNYKKLANWKGKRVHLTKVTIEHLVHKDAIECPKIITKEAVLKHEIKIKFDLKEGAKDEKKEACTQNLKNEVKENYLLIH